MGDYQEIDCDTASCIYLAGGTVWAASVMEDRLVKLGYKEDTNRYLPEGRFNPALKYYIEKHHETPDQNNL